MGATQTRKLSHKKIAKFEFERNTWHTLDKINLDEFCLMPQIVSLAHSILNHKIVSPSKAKQLIDRLDKEEEIEQEINSLL